MSAEDHPGDQPSNSHSPGQILDHGEQNQLHESTSEERISEILRNYQPQEMFVTESQIEIAQNLLNTGTMSDCLLVLGNNTEIEVHSLFLVANSSVFERLIKNATENKPVIRLPEEDPVIFEKFLKYLYFYEVEPSSVEEGIQLCDLAYKYKTVDLLGEFMLFLGSMTYVGNAWKILDCAVRCNLDFLKQEVLKVMSSDPHKTMDILSMSRVDQRTVLYFLDQTNVDVPSEEALFQAVVSWSAEQCRSEDLPASPFNKRMHLENLIPKIHFGAMTLDGFKKGPVNFNVLKRKEIQQITEYLTNPQKNQLPPNFCKERKPRRMNRKVTFECDEKIISWALFDKPFYKDFHNIAANTDVEYTLLCKSNCTLRKIFLKGQIKDESNLAPRFQIYNEDIEVMIEGENFEPVQVSFQGAIQKEAEVELELNSPIVCNQDEKLTLRLHFNVGGTYEISRAKGKFEPYFETIDKVLITAVECGFPE